MERINFLNLKLYYKSVDIKQHNFGRKTDPQISRMDLNILRLFPGNVIN